MPVAYKNRSRFSRKRIRWNAVFTLVAVFAGSIFVGRLLGNKLLGARPGTNSSSDLFRAPPSLPLENFTPSSAPNIRTEAQRQEIEPPPLVLPPPVAESNDSDSGKKTEESPSPESPASSGPYKVQVGLFTQRKGADDLAQSLAGERYSCFVEPVKEDQANLFRVFLGPFENLAAADSVKKKLQDSGYSAFILETPAGKPSH